MEAVERIILNNDWTTLILVSCLLLLAVVKLAYESYFIDFIELVVNQKYLIKSSQEIKFENPFNLLLFTVQLLSISLFLFIVAEDFSLLNNTTPSSLLFLRVFLFYSLFIGVKYLTEKMAAVLFNGEKEVEIYHYHKLVYRNYFAILLIPVNALLIYTFEPDPLAIKIIIGVLLLLNGVSLFNTLKKYEKLIYSHLFYFILYLCAFEIAPYFILFKLLSIDV
ncbi:MAG: DUF4271 domain-containing protein [Leeuwenhoekiella sp.]